MSAANATGPRWGWIIAIIFAVLLLGMCNSGTDTRTSTYTPSSSSSTDTTSYPGSGVSQIDRTLTPQEREQYARDPSSRGFSDEDRDFLKEHGVSEDEARAAETILREQGIN